jgi:hypothetical protein
MDMLHVVAELSRAATLGLTPLQSSSGGKERMGRISRIGDRYLRGLLVVGMTLLVRRTRTAPSSVDPRMRYGPRTSEGALVLYELA